MEGPARAGHDPGRSRDRTDGHHSLASFKASQAGGAPDNPFLTADRGIRDRPGSLSRHFGARLKQPLGSILHDRRRARLRGSACEAARAGRGRDHYRRDRRRRYPVRLFRPDDKRLTPGPAYDAYRSNLGRGILDVPQLLAGNRRMRAVAASREKMRGPEALASAYPPRWSTRATLICT